MSGNPVLTALQSLLLEPTFGIPLLLAIALAVGWVLFGPGPGERRPAPLRRSWFEPGEDLPSRVYFALADGEYSRVVDAAAARLEEAVFKHRKISVYHLPTTAWGAQRLGVPEAGELRHALRALSRVHAEAVERESRFFLRWRFWLPAEVDRERYLDRLGTAVDEAARCIHLVGETS